MGEDPLLTGRLGTSLGVLGGGADPGPRGGRNRLVSTGCFPRTVRMYRRTATTPPTSTSTTRNETGRSVTPALDIRSRPFSPPARVPGSRVL